MTAHVNMKTRALRVSDEAWEAFEAYRAQAGLSAGAALAQLLSAPTDPVARSVPVVNESAQERLEAAISTAREAGFTVTRASQIVQRPTMYAQGTGLTPVRRPSNTGKASMPDSVPFAGDLPRRGSMFKG